MYVLLLIQQLIAGSTHLVAKGATTLMHPTTVVLIRGMFTVAAFGIWWLVRKSRTTPVERSDWPMIILLGFINLPVNQLCFIWGVRYTTAPNAALAYALTPVFVVVLLSVWKRMWPGWKRILGVLTALAGATIVLMDKGASIRSEHLIGNTMVLLASASWALYTVLGRRIVARYGALYATSLTFFTGLPLYAIVWLVLPVPADFAPLFQTDTAATMWFELFYLGVITSGIGYGLWYYALTHMETHRVAVFNNLQPIITTILALLIFGTQPTLMFAIGGCIALGGVVMVQKD